MKSICKNKNFVDSGQFIVSNRKLGQSILEILIALSILMISMAAVIVVAFSNQYISNDTQTNNEAYYLAQDNLESAKAKAKENFDSIANSTVSTGIYTKEIVVENLSLNEKKIISRVTWRTDTLRTQKIELVTIVANVVVIPGGGDDNGGSGLTGDWRNPVTLGSVDLGPGNSATDLDVINKIVYMTSEASAESKPDFYIINAADGSSPFIVSELNTGLGLNALDAIADYAYVANNSSANQLQIINIANAQNPSIAASLSLPGVVSAVGASIFYNDSKIYIGTKNDLGPEFHIIDVTISSNPVALGSFEVGGDVNSISVSGGSAYIATSVNDGEVKILNVAAPALITQIGSYNAPDANDGKVIRAVGSKAYLGRLEEEDELDILDIANPLSILRLGSKDIDADVNGLLTRECLSFLGTDDSNKELQIWNTSNPANINLWASFNFPQVIASIDYESNIVYVGVRSNDALRIITSQVGGPPC